MYLIMNEDCIHPIVICILWLHLPSSKNYYHCWSLNSCYLLMSLYSHSDVQKQCLSCLRTQLLGSTWILPCPRRSCRQKLPSPPVAPDLSWTAAPCTETFSSLSRLLTNWNNKMCSAIKNVGLPEYNQSFHFMCAYNIAMHTWVYSEHDWHHWPWRCHDWVHWSDRRPYPCWYADNIAPPLLTLAPQCQ